RKSAAERRGVLPARAGGRRWPVAILSRRDSWEQSRLADYGIGHCSQSVANGPDGPGIWRTGAEFVTAPIPCPTNEYGRTRLPAKPPPNGFISRVSLVRIQSPLVCLRQSCTVGRLSSFVLAGEP